MRRNGDLKAVEIFETWFEDKYGCMPLSNVVPCSVTRPSVMPISVASITDPAGCWRHPECRSSPRLAGLKDFPFKFSKVIGIVVVAGKMVCSICIIAGSKRFPSWTSGNDERVRLKGNIAGDRDCLFLVSLY